MKCFDYAKEVRELDVAPFVGAWVEINPNTLKMLHFFVAPFVGAWVEIVQISKNECVKLVAPFVGAWVEIGPAGHP